MESPSRMNGGCGNEGFEKKAALASREKHQSVRPWTQIRNILMHFSPSGPRNKICLGFSETTIINGRRIICRH